MYCYERKQSFPNSIPFFLKSSIWILFEIFFISYQHLKIFLLKKSWQVWKRKFKNWRNCVNEYQFFFQKKKRKFFVIFRIWPGQRNHEKFFKFKEQFKELKFMKPFDAASHRLIAATNSALESLPSESWSANCQIWARVGCGRPHCSRILKKY